MTTVIETPQEFTTADRCDKCGAQAMVRATLANGELYFCGHHGRELSRELIASSLNVFDPEGVFNYANR
jgi:hypothetical protein